MPVLSRRRGVCNDNMVLAETVRGHGRLLLQGVLSPGLGEEA